MLILPLFSRGGPGLICCSVMIVTPSIPKAFPYRRHMVILNLSEHEPAQMHNTNVYRQVSVFL